MHREYHKVEPQMIAVYDRLMTELASYGASISRG
jgi:hypothetical protein